MPFTPPSGPVKRVGVVSVPSVQRVPSCDVAFQPHQPASKPQPATGEGVASVGAVPGQVVVVALRTTSASASHRILAPVTAATHRSRHTSVSGVAPLGQPRSAKRVVRPLGSNSQPHASPDVAEAALSRVLPPNANAKNVRGAGAPRRRHEDRGDARRRYGPLHAVEEARLGLAA